MTETFTLEKHTFRWPYTLRLRLVFCLSQRLEMCRDFPLSFFNCFSLLVWTQLSNTAVWWPRVLCPGMHLCHRARVVWRRVPRCTSACIPFMWGNVCVCVCTRPARCRILIWMQKSFADGLRWFPEEMQFIQLLHNTNPEVLMSENSCFYCCVKCVDILNIRYIFSIIWNEETVIGIVAVFVRFLCPNLSQGLPSVSQISGYFHTLKNISSEIIADIIRSEPVRKFSKHYRKVTGGWRPAHECWLCLTANSCITCHDPSKPSSDITDDIISSIL